MRRFRRRREPKAWIDATLIGDLVDDAVREERRRIAAWLRTDDGVDPDQAAINRVMAGIIEKGTYVADR